MTLSELKRIMAGSADYTAENRVNKVLPRYAAMAGLHIPPCCVSAPGNHPYTDDIPMEIVQKIIALDFAERATGDLRAAGEAIGRLQLNVPSNINVWSHVKGAQQLVDAANGLTEATKSLTRGNH